MFSAILEAPVCKSTGGQEAILVNGLPAQYSLAIMEMIQTVFAPSTNTEMLRSLQVRFIDVTRLRALVAYESVSLRGTSTALAALLEVNFICMHMYAYRHVK